MIIHRPKMTKSSEITINDSLMVKSDSTTKSLKMEEDTPLVSLLGQPCGQHASYTFYKAFSYRRKSTDLERVLMLGEFFFVRITPHDDPCIGELQLLWEDHQRNQLLSSTRLYFLPEQTPDGRQSHHGQHEVLAAQDKVILRLSDLVTWITHKVDWVAGLPYQWKAAINDDDDDRRTKKSNDTTANNDNDGVCGLSSLAFIHNQNVMRPDGLEPFLTSQRYINDRCRIRLATITNNNNLETITGTTTTNSNSSSNISSSISSPPVMVEPPICHRRSFSCSRVDFSDIIPRKLKVNEHQCDLSTVVVLSYTRYCRYRSLLKRIEGQQDAMLSTKIVQDALAELGIPLQRNRCVHILFCRDTFSHEALLNNDLNCDHLAPKLKGRPRKRPLKCRALPRASSPESISSDENNRLFPPRRTRRTAALATSTARALNNQNQSSVTVPPAPPQRQTKQRKSNAKQNSKQQTKRTQQNLDGQSKCKSNEVDNIETSSTGKRITNNNAKTNTANNKKTDNNKENKPEMIDTEDDGGEDEDSANADDDDGPDDDNSMVRFKDEISKNKEVFLRELHSFMKKRKVPIRRVPKLGFRKIDLHQFFTKAQKYGGYKEITRRRLWKRLYDDMCGDKPSTSAATCTRRHYERLLLPFERMLQGLPAVPESESGGPTIDGDATSDDTSFSDESNSKDDDSPKSETSPATPPQEEVVPLVTTETQCDTVSEKNDTKDAQTTGLEPELKKDEPIKLDPADLKKEESDIDQVPPVEVPPPQPVVKSDEIPVMVKPSVPPARPVLFSNLHSHTKMTALVHPTVQRKPTAEMEPKQDVYDFQDSPDQEMSIFQQKSGFLHKPLPPPEAHVSKTSIQKPLTPPEMPPPVNTYFFPALLPQPGKIYSNTTYTPGGGDSNVPLIPPPSPKNQPLPAHRHSFPIGATRSGCADILDLSVKKRFRETENHTGLHPAAKLMRTDVPTSAGAGLLDLSITASKQPPPPQMSSPYMTKDLERLMRTNLVPKLSATNSSGVIEINRQQLSANKTVLPQPPPPPSLVHHHHHRVREEKSSRTTKHSKLPNSTPQLPPPPPSSISISDYNPQLPQFIGSHAPFWSNWSVPPFAGLGSSGQPSSSTRTVTGSHPSPAVATCFPSPFAGNSSASLAQQMQMMDNQAKMLQAAYHQMASTAPSFIGGPMAPPGAGFHPIHHHHQLATLFAASQSSSK